MINLPLQLSGLALFLAWLLPNHHLPWTAFYNDLFAAITLLLLATGTFLRPPITSKVEIPRIIIALLAITFIPLLQLALGLIQFGGDAWVASLYLAGLSLAYISGHQIGGASTAIRTTYALAGLFILGSLVSLFLAAHQWLFTGRLGIWVIDMAPGGRPFANLAQPNNLATLFCLGLASTIYLHTRGQIGGLVTALIALPVFAGIAMTMSRTPFLILTVMAGWTLWNRNRLNLKFSATQVAASLAIFVAFWILWPKLSDALLLTGGPESTAMAAERVQQGLRPIIWTQLLDAAMREPLTGYGWNQVSTAQIAVAEDYTQSVLVDHSHNIMLDLLLWNGLLLGGGIVLLLAWWLFTRLRGCPNKESWFALTVIMAVGVHGLLELPLEYAYFLFPVGLCAGIVDRFHATTRIKVPKWSMVGIVLLGWTVLSVVFFEYSRAEEDFRRMRFESIGLEKRKPASETVQLMFLTQLPEYTRFARTEAREHMTSAEIDWMGRVAHRYPHPPALLRYALALGLNHRYDEASLELVRLQRLHHPRHIEQAKQAWLATSERYPMLRNVHLP